MLKGAAAALNFGRGTCKPYSISALFIVLLVLCPILWSAPIKWCISAARKHSLLFFFPSYLPWTEASDISYSVEVFVFQTDPPKYFMTAIK